MRAHKVIIIFLFVSISCLYLQGADVQKREFERVNENELFHTFFQDDVGFVWAGTAHALYRYDGKMLHPVFISSNLNTRTIIVYQLLKSQKGGHYIATNKGICRFDMLTHRMSLVEATANLDVRSLVESSKGTLLFGTMNGLYMYVPEKNKLIHLKGLSAGPVSDVVCKSGDVYWVGGNKGLFEVDLQKKTCRRVSVEGVDGTFVTSIERDDVRKILWLGNDTGLYGYNWQTQKTKAIKKTQHNTVGDLLLSRTGKELWIGTDNGLYVYNPGTDVLNHYTHSTRQSSSLVNNVVSNFFEDRDGNIWIGTNCGATVYYRYNPFLVYSWEDIAHSDEGNRIQCVFQDSRGNNWYGGTNGLGRFNAAKGIHQWFRMNDPQFYIANNRVHQVFEDKERTLWISSDRGLHRFDYEKDCFYPYNIMDQSHNRNANWAYGIFDDKQGKLWVSVYLSGLFAMDKTKIKRQNGGAFVADKLLCQANGKLISDRVCYATIDSLQNIWASTNQNGIHKIDVKTGKVTFFSEQISGHRLRDNNVNCIIADGKGSVWVAEESGLDRIDIRTGKVEPINDCQLNNRWIDSLVDLGDWLGIVTGERFFLFNKQSGKLIKIDLEGKRYSCACLDRSGRTIILGGVDQSIELEWRKFLDCKGDHTTLLLASLRIMNQDVSVGKEFQGRMVLEKDLNQTQQIILGERMRGLEITICENRIRKAVNKHYSYRLKGLSDQWVELENIPTNITFGNLSPGDYVLQFKERDSDNPFRELKITLLSPWFASTWAKIIYTLIFLLLVGYLLREYQIRNSLKIENVKKEKTLELSKMKMEFLTNISHELKTPLSLIMGPLGDLLPQMKSEGQKKKIKVAYDNSVKLNSLVHQILDYKETSNQSEKLHSMPVELVEFVGSIASGFKEAFSKKQIELIIEPSESGLYVQADAVKLESVFTNILSNALKYSLSGGTVYVRITTDSENQAVVGIQDSGVGIPQEDLSHVFERFYQSEHNRQYNSDGSGIGLSLVKHYVELYGGKVELSSEKGKGTLVSVRLPLSEKSEEPTLSEEIQGNAPLVLIVEDNAAIADYICSSLQDYRCLLAHNGRHGLELAIKESPALIITDIMMPIMDGIELLKALKKNVETALIPVIMLTAKDNPETESQVLALGADAFVSKPFDIELLRVRVDKIIHTKTQIISTIRQQKMVSTIETGGVDISPNEKFLQEINRIIEEQLENPELNVQRLSELSGFSAKQIYRKLKELTGHTAVDYIKSIRLKKAAFLLSQQKFTVSEVMYMVGFSNSSYFSKCFSEMYGKTPKQYML